MMMPANFSAISENEMTYVNGGASLADILAPELKVENWQKFNHEHGHHYRQLLSWATMSTTLSAFCSTALTSPATWATHGTPTSRVLTAPAPLLASASIMVG